MFATPKSVQSITLKRPINHLDAQSITRTLQMCPINHQDASRSLWSVQKQSWHFKATQGRINKSKRRIWRPGGLEPPYIYLLPRYKHLPGEMCMCSKAFYFYSDVNIQQHSSWTKSNFTQYETYCDVNINSNHDLVGYMFKLIKWPYSSKYVD